MDTRPTAVHGTSSGNVGNFYTNQQHHQVSDFSYTGDESKLVLVLVGLPARGKTFIARKISSYLSWLGIRVRWFNVGYYRRLCATNTVGTSSANFFDPSNEAATKQRELFALLALAELEKYLKEGGEVAILDGTNTTKARRTLIKNFFARNPHSKRKRKNHSSKSSLNNSSNNSSSKKNKKYQNIKNVNPSATRIRDLSDPHYKESAFGNRNNNQDRSHGGNDISNQFGDSGSLSPHSGTIDSQTQVASKSQTQTQTQTQGQTQVQSQAQTQSQSQSQPASVSRSKSRGKNKNGFLLSNNMMKPVRSGASSFSASSNGKSHQSPSNGNGMGGISDYFDGSKVQIVFIESICNDPAIIEQNIIRVKLTSPDYADVPPHEAVRDFKRRIKHYEKVYEQVDESDGSYIKMINAGKHVVGHQVNGYLPARILYFLMHLNLEQVPIFLTRHGESEFNIENKIGGNASLSAAGRRYSQTMCDFITLQPEFRKGLVVWCSTLKRTMETSQPFRGLCPIYKWKALSEIEAGICDGMTYAQIKYEMPNEWNARKIDKLTYRYPQGESYKDVIQRLEPVIFELERATKPVLVVAHRAVLRCLYAYFMDKPLKDIPYLPMELHTVYKLQPSDYKTTMDKFTFGFLASRTAPSSVEKDTYFDDMDNNEHLPMYQFHNKMRKKYKLLKATDSDDSDSEYNHNRNITPLTLNINNNGNNINNNNNNNNQIGNSLNGQDALYRPRCNSGLSYSDLRIALQNDQSISSYTTNDSVANDGSVVQGYQQQQQLLQVQQQQQQIPLSRYQRNNSVFSYHRSKHFGDQTMDGRSVADSVDSVDTGLLAAAAAGGYSGYHGYGGNGAYFLKNQRNLNYQILKQSQTPPFPLASRAKKRNNMISNFILNGSTKRATSDQTNESIDNHNSINKNDDNENGNEISNGNRNDKNDKDNENENENENDDSGIGNLSLKTTKRRKGYGMERKDSIKLGKITSSIRPSMSSPTLSRLPIVTNNKSRRAVKVGTMEEIADHDDDHENYNNDNDNDNDNENNNNKNNNNTDSNDSNNEKKGTVEIDDELDVE